MENNQVVVMPEMPEEMKHAMQIMQEKQEIIQKIRGVFPDTKFPNVEGQLLAHYQRGTELKDSTLLPEKSILVGTFDTPEKDGMQFPYGIVSPQYKLVTHEEMIYNVLDGLKDNASSWGKPEIKIRLWNFGARMRFNIDFPKFEAVNIAINDPVSLRISGTNSYDLALEFKVAAEALVLKCENGMVGTEVLEKYNCRHKGSLDIKMSKSVLSDSVSAFLEQAAIWKKWATLPMPAEKFQPVFDGLPFGERQSKEMLALPIIQYGAPLNERVIGGKASLWDVNLMVTQYLTHKCESEMVKMRKGAEVSSYLHEVAVEMAA